MTGPARTPGVLGGMGPAATIDFMGKVLAYSHAATGADSREQDGVRLIVDSNPAVPDRNGAVAGTGPSPGPALAGMAKGLERAGADFLVMPCNAAHAFADDVTAATTLPFVNLITETAQHLKTHHPDVHRVGVLAVAGCIDARLYERALEPLGVEVVTPRDLVREKFMATVWRIKAGDVGAASRDAMLEVVRALEDHGIEALIAGCTEVPLVLNADGLGMPFIDSTAVLAQRTVAYALGADLPEYSKRTTSCGGFIL